MTLWELAILLYEEHVDLRIEPDPYLSNAVDITITRDRQYFREVVSIEHLGHMVEPDHYLDIILNRMMEELNNHDSKGTETGTSEIS